MSTKTMRLPPRRVSITNNVKRKERDESNLQHYNRPPQSKSPIPAVPLTAHPPLSNHLLAGYLAHEFLTRETLFGQTFDPTRTQQIEASKRSRAEDVVPEPKSKPDDHQRYVEVASLLKTNGAHIPGIVNPSQLDRLLQM